MPYSMTLISHLLLLHYTIPSHVHYRSLWGVTHAFPQVKERAVSTLHALVRGNNAHVNALAAQPDAATSLMALLSAYGPNWYRCKADAHCLLNLLDRAKAAADASGSGSGAEGALDAPVMVERPDALA